MIRQVFALAILGAAATPACAQDAIPDLKGAWTGKGKSIVFGNNAHHAGRQSTSSPPRVREGQEGRPAWGRSSSAAADIKEPFAWAIASDNKSIVGADMDGYFRITILSPDRMEKCYAQNAARPSRAIVASWQVMDRVKR